MNPLRDRRTLLSRLPTAAQLRRMTARQVLVERAVDRALADSAMSVLAQDPANHEVIARSMRVVARLAADPMAALDLQELADLEVLMLLVTRPAMFVRDGRLGPAPSDWPELSHARIPARISAVGRLERDGEPCGTGFVVAPGRLLTNNHVLWCLVREPHEALLPLSTWKTSPGLFARRVDEAVDGWIGGAGPALELRGEDGRLDSSRIVIRGVIARHRTLDVAVLESGVTPPAVQPLPIASTDPGLAAGRPVYLIGYPLIDVGPPYDTADLVRIFGPPSAWRARKRLAPGRVTEVDGEVLWHDASTLGGSSGSCVVDLETHEVVAIHRGGRVETGNHAVPLWNQRRWAIGA